MPWSSALAADADADLPSDIAVGMRVRSRRTMYADQGVEFQVNSESEGTITLIDDGWYLVEFDLEGQRWIAPEDFLHLAIKGISSGDAGKLADIECDYVSEPDDFIEEPEPAEEPGAAGSLDCGGSIMSEEPEPRVRPADFTNADPLDLLCAPASGSSSPRWTPQAVEQPYRVKPTFVDPHAVVKPTLVEVPGTRVAPGAMLGPAQESQESHFSKLHGEYGAKLERHAYRKEMLECEEAALANEFAKATVRPGTVEEIAKASERLYREAERRRRRMEERQYQEEYDSVQDRSKTISRSHDSEPRWEKLYAHGLGKEKRLELEREQVRKEEEQYLEEISIHRAAADPEVQDKRFERLYNDSGRRDRKIEEKREEEERWLARSQAEESVHKTGAVSATMVEERFKWLSDDAQQRKVRFEEQQRALQAKPAPRAASGGPGRFERLYGDAARRDEDRKLFKDKLAKDEVEQLKAVSVHAAAQQRPRGEDELQEVFERMSKTAPQKRAASSGKAGKQHGRPGYPIATSSPSSSPDPDIDRADGDAASNVSGRSGDARGWARATRWPGQPKQSSNHNSGQHLQPTKSPCRTPSKQAAQRSVTPPHTARTAEAPQIQIVAPAAAQRGLTPPPTAVRTSSSMRNLTPPPHSAASASQRALTPSRRGSVSSTASSAAPRSTTPRADGAASQKATTPRSGGAARQSKTPPPHAAQRVVPTPEHSIGVSRQRARTPPPTTAGSQALRARTPPPHSVASTQHQQQQHSRAINPLLGDFYTSDDPLVPPSPEPLADARALLAHMLQEDTPDAYVITNAAGVFPTATSLAEDDIVAFLHVGQVIKVVDVQHSVAEHRVRGRLENPAGWITLLHTQDGFRWAEKQSKQKRSRSRGRPGTMEDDQRWERQPATPSVQSDTSSVYTRPPSHRSTTPPPTVGARELQNHSTLVPVSGLAHANDKGKDRSAIPPSKIPSKIPKAAGREVPAPRLMQRLQEESAVLAKALQPHDQADRSRASTPPRQSSRTPSKGQ